jgi:hypothetical protein
MNRFEPTPTAGALAWLAAGLLSAAAGLSPAHAGEATAPGGGAWQGLDADHDGRISRAEAQHDSALAKRFDALDANRDGTLDAAELAASENEDNEAAARGTEVKR